MKRVQVLNASEYVSKKTGNMSWRITALDSDGNVITFFRPYEEMPEKGNNYVVSLEYDAFNYGYRPHFEKETK